MHWEGDMQCHNPDTECWADLRIVEDCEHCPYFGAYLVDDDEEGREFW